MRKNLSNEEIATALSDKDENGLQTIVGLLDDETRQSLFGFLQSGTTVRSRRPGATATGLPTNNAVQSSNKSGFKRLAGVFVVLSIACAVLFAIWDKFAPKFFAETPVVATTPAVATPTPTAPAETHAASAELTVEIFEQQRTNPSVWPDNNKDLNWEYPAKSPAEVAKKEVEVSHTVVEGLKLGEWVNFDKQWFISLRLAGPRPWCPNFASVFSPEQMTNHTATLKIDGKDTIVKNWSRFHRIIKKDGTVIFKGPLGVVNPNGTVGKENPMADWQKIRETISVGLEGNLLAAEPTPEQIAGFQKMFSEEVKPQYGALPVVIKKVIFPKTPTWFAKLQPKQ